MTQDFDGATRLFGDPLDGLAKHVRRLRISFRTLTGFAVALGLHVLLVAIAVVFWQGAPGPDAPRFQSITVSLAPPAPAPQPSVEPDSTDNRAGASVRTPAAAQDDAMPAESPAAPPQPMQTETAPTPTTPQPAQEGPSPAEAAPAPAPAQTNTRPAEERVNVLTAEGGQARFTVDAQPGGSALRGVVCATGSSHMRQAAGCDGEAGGVFAGGGLYAGGADEIRIDRMFSPPPGQDAYSGFTVDFSGRAAPGRIFSQHSHFASGANAALGQLPVAEKARDPGFGD